MAKIAFEVEIISTRQNFVYVLDEAENSMYLYDTSRKPDGSCDKYLVKVFKEKNFFDFDCKDAKELFRYLYKESLTPGITKPMFLYWVNPETFVPEEDE